MKRFLAIGSILAVLTLSACGTNDEHEGHNAAKTDEVPEIVEVDLIVPETVTAGEKVVIAAAVTQDGEIVEDANEVKIEVLNLTSGEKEMIVASLNEDKQYAIDYTFKTNGTYDITSHVTARDMHIMPTKQTTVTGGEETSSKVTDTSTEGKAHGDDSHHSHGATIDFADGSATVGEAVMLIANVSLTDAPLEGARVRYEISRSDDDHHTWLEAPEKGAGVYQTEFTFTESGTYEIQVHVTKGDDVHDHVVKTYTVK